jgi:uncharacterized protein YodC (DUF2158 family)
VRFKEGDVVRLRSGGPNMTVEQVGEQHMLPGKTVAFCVWFEVVAKQRVVKRNTFSLSVLEAVNHDAEPLTSKPSYF